MTPGAGPCFDSKTSPMVESHKFFPLDVQKAEGCDSRYAGLKENSETVILDSMHLNEYLKVNEIE